MHRNRLHSQNVNGVTCKLNQIPPFQLELPGLFNRPFQITLINRRGDIPNKSIRYNLEQAGLEVISGDAENDIILGQRTRIVYRANLPIPGLNAVPGEYQLKLRSIEGQYWSEYFVMKPHFTNHVYLEWCHAEDIRLPNQLIKYPGLGYKNFTWFYSDMNYPEYEYEEEVEKRDGKDFPLKQISYKVLRFHTVASEYLMDVLRLIPLHDFVAFEHQEVRYKIDRIFVTPTPLKGDRMAGVEIEMRYDTVVVVNGRGLNGVIDCDKQTIETCELVQDTAKKTVLNNGSEYNGHYYEDENSNKIDLVDGDIIVVNWNTSYTIAEIESAGSYVQYSQNNVYIYDEQLDKYYFTLDDGGETVLWHNRIIQYFIPDNHLTWHALPDTIVEIYVVGFNGEERLFETIPSENNIGPGVNGGERTIDVRPGERGVRLRFYSDVCGIRESEQKVFWDFDYNGPPVTTTPYPTDEDLKGNDLARPGDLYPLSKDNPYGLPEFFVKQFDPERTYYDDNQATRAFGYDIPYPLSKDNPYGANACEGLMRIIPFNIPVYADDAEAAAAGVQIDEKYVTEGTKYGFSGHYLKMRKT